MEGFQIPQKKIVKIVCLEYLGLRPNNNEPIIRLVSEYI